MALDYLTADTQEVKEVLSYIRETEQALKTAAENYRPMIREGRYRSSAGMQIPACLVANFTNPVGCRGI